MRSQDLTNNCIIYSIRTIQAGHRWFTPVRVDSTRTLDRGTVHVGVTDHKRQVCTTHKSFCKL